VRLKFEITYPLRRQLKKHTLLLLPLKIYLIVLKHIIVRWL